MDGAETAATTPHDYVIGGVTYRLVEKLGYQQCRWLGQTVLKGIDLHRLTYAIAHDVVREQGPLVMAICLVPLGSTRHAHARLTLEEIHARAELFAAEMDPEAVMAFTIPFFQLLGPASVFLLTPGTVIQGLYLAESNSPPAVASPAPGPSGSSAVLSSSVEETLPKSSGSSPTGDRPTLIPIFGGASNGRPLTSPFSDGAA